MAMPALLAGPCRSLRRPCRVFPIEKMEFRRIPPRGGKEAPLHQLHFEHIKTKDLQFISRVAVTSRAPSDLLTHLQAGSAPPSPSLQCIPSPISPPFF